MRVTPTCVPIRLIQYPFSHTSYISDSDLRLVSRECHMWVPGMPASIRVYRMTPLDTPRLIMGSSRGMDVQGDSQQAGSCQRYMIFISVTACIACIMHAYDKWHLNLSTRSSTRPPHCRIPAAARAGSARVSISHSSHYY